jgi:hypothetical protein
MILWSKSTYDIKGNKTKSVVDVAPFCAKNVKIKLQKTKLTMCVVNFVGRDCSVGMVTHCMLDSLGIESRWEQDFLHSSRLVLGPTQPPYTMGTRSFPGLKQPEHGFDLPPHLMSGFKKE